KQWFVRMEPLAEPAIAAVRDGKTKFVPDRFEKTYFHWMENIRDWCISRQLWWGHRIPAYYCADCGETVVSGEEVTTCPKCGSHNMNRDPDTLDTWFSSALWPFSTLGWPDKTPELDYFYPTSTLVTGYDIIFFWVARMIFSGCEQMGEVPFETTLIHGLVRDAQGRKMSKSLGNGIDPLEIIDLYGADTLRFTLATGNSPGNDMRFSDDKVKASRNFANKIWNASRFILMNLPDEITECKLPAALETEDKWVVSLYNTLVKEVTENMEKFELGIAVQKLYDFIWDILCDWYIELTKSRIQAGGETALAAQQVLVYVTANTLKLLHPFMPFITEEIWQSLPHAGEGDSIMIAKWPEYDPALSFAKEEADFQKVMDMIRAIRNQRAEMNIPPSKKAKVFIETGDIQVFQDGAPFMLRLASASEVEVGSSFAVEGAVQVITSAARAFIPMNELIDRDKELARLTKEKDKCESDIGFIEKKLENPGFLAKAPAQLVESERAKIAEHKERLAKILESIKALG
ncbi:MAG: class I tRNA ligase family protein, partial [Angelakisella sp.]